MPSGASCRIGATWIGLFCAVLLAQETAALLAPSAAGAQNLQQGYDKAIDAMGQVGEDENMKLEHRLSFLSLVGSIAPMVGLLGTVDGMVQSFMEIARSTTQPKPSVLAQGISMALITTLVGLVLAIPAIIAFNMMKNRLSRLVMETAQLASSLMSRFETMGKK